jgi:hypothetical protein
MDMKLQQEFNIYRVMQLQTFMLKGSFDNNMNLRLIVARSLFVFLW